MVTIGTGGIHIAARLAKAVAHALTINSLRSTHASWNFRFLIGCKSEQHFLLFNCSTSSLNSLQVFVKNILTLFV